MAHNADIEDQCIKLLMHWSYILIDDQENVTVNYF